jgi:hypothetical protein
MNRIKNAFKQLNAGQQFATVVFFGYSSLYLTGLALYYLDLWGLKDQRIEPFYPMSFAVYIVAGGLTWAFLALWGFAAYLIGFAVFSSIKFLMLFIVGNELTEEESDVKSEYDSDNQRRENPSSQN